MPLLPIFWKQYQTRSWYNAFVVGFLETDQALAHTEWNIPKASDIEEHPLEHRTGATLVRTWSHLDAIRTVWDLLGGEVDVDRVEADLFSQILAAPLALLHLLQLQHGRVLFALRVEDDHLWSSLSGVCAEIETWWRYL